MKSNFIKFYRLPFKLVLFIGFYFITGGAFGQNDCSCKTELSEKYINERDSLKVFELSEKLKNSTFKSCLFEGLTLELGYYTVQGKMDKAYSLLVEQEEILKKMECKNQFKYELYANKARYYRAANDYEKLSDFAFKALKEAERLDDPKKEILSIKDVVFLFTRMREGDKNWEYIKRAEHLITHMEFNKSSITDYRWLAFQYEYIYARTERKTLIDSALIFINRAKKGAFEYGMDEELAQSYRALEAFAYHRGELNKALVYIDSAIYYGKKIKGVKSLGPFYLAKAWDHLDLGQFEEANKWMDTAVVRDFPKSTAAHMMLLSEAAQIYEGVGKLDKAYTSFKKYSKIKDSILNIERIKKVNELETRYKTELKDAEIAVLGQQQKIDSLEIETKQGQIKWLALIIALAALTILGILFVYRQITGNNKIKMMQTEQRLNRARINPHFFFNAMASLQGFSYQEDSPKTALFISRFAKIMRQSLENTYEEMVTVEKELDFLTQYLEIQKLRYPEKFEFSFQIDDALEVEDLKIPGMILQPFVENSIEHGFKNITYKGSIAIAFKEIGSQLEIHINDNGKGISTSEQDKDYPSRAMQIIQDRLSLFNKQHGANAHFRLPDDHGINGFKIVVTLPKIYNT